MALFNFTLLHSAMALINSTLLATFYTEGKISELPWLTLLHSTMALSTILNSCSHGSAWFYIPPWFYFTLLYPNTSLHGSTLYSTLPYYIPPWFYFTLLQAMALRDPTWPYIATPYHGSTSLYYTQSWLFLILDSTLLNSILALFDLLSLLHSSYHGSTWFCYILATMTLLDSATF